MLGKQQLGKLCFHIIVNIHILLGPSRLQQDLPPSLGNGELGLSAYEGAIYLSKKK